MTHKELIEMVAESVGASYEEAHGFIQEFIDIVIRRLDDGDEVKVRGLGTFKWVPVKGKKIPLGSDFGPQGDDVGSTRHFALPDGKKLRFVPSTRFRTRRTEMPDNEEGMNKYGVETEEPDDKTASDDTVRVCPVCASDLDSGGACPKHGTEPFEPDGQG